MSKLRLGVRYLVDELVPHRGPMSLLDSIDDYGEDWLRSSLTVRPDSTFAVPGGVPGWAGIEYMAQTACALAGIEPVQRGDRPSIGLLIGSRYYRCMLDLIPLGAHLQVFAKVVMRDAEDFAAYECTLSAGSQRIAECTLKAYRPRDLGTLLEAAARD
jgi:predicted hotdog family 3-hydroxylacyl-ACP dehydratase